MKLAIVLLLCLFAGCAQTGGIFFNPFTGEWTVRNPANAEGGANLTVSADGAVSASVSGERAENTVAKALWFLPWLGAALMILGLATLVLRAWLPTMPLTASLAAMGLGAAFTFLPTIIQEAWWLVAGGLVALVVMYGVAWFDNRKKLSTPTPPLSQP